MDASLGFKPPEKWKYWFEYICDALCIQSNIPISEQSFRSPFFILPTKPEISDNDEKDFFKTIRDYLFQYGKSRRDIRYQLERLKTNESIVYLYAMRYVAFKYGESHRYWPELRRVLFNNEIDYQDVAIGLAEDSSDLWIRLYEETSGALYFPREGPRHIKWPLAHAGLLSNDKNVLKEFGIYIISSDLDFFNNVLYTELEEFLLTFKDWLVEIPEYKISRLGKLFLGRSSEREVIAELCQQWLKAHSDELKTRAENGNSSQGKKAIPIRRTLFINRDIDCIGLKIGIGAIEGRKKIYFKFNEKNYEVPIQYQSIEDKTKPLDLTINLESPNWKELAEIYIDKNIIKVNLPKCEIDESIVFEGKSGIRTRNWQPNNEYYILIPQKRFEETKAQVLFSDWMFLNLPKGGWDNYLLLWARTKNPYIIEQQESKLTLTNLIIKIEAILDEMKLPSFGHQIRVSSRIFGGEIIKTTSTVNNIYNRNRPPYLELEGFWKDDQKLILLKQEELSGLYNSYCSSIIPHELSGTHQVVEVMDESPEDGLYQISLHNNNFHFGLLDQNIVSIVNNERQFKLSIQFIDSFCNKQNSPSKYEIDKYFLKIASWPFADLSLDIYLSDILSSRTISLQVDETGEWNCSLMDLNLESFIARSGNLHFKVSWRGLFSQEIVALDKAFVSYSEFNYKTKELNNRQIVNFSGKITGPMKTKSIGAIFFSSPPWFKYHVYKNISINADQKFFGECLLDWKPFWIVISNEFESNNILIIKELNQESRSKQNEIDLSLLANEESNTNWIDLAEEIVNSPHPPSLDRYLEFLPKLRFYREIYLLLESLSYWKYYSDWEDWPSITYYLKNGCFFAIFGEKPEIGKKARNVICDHSIKFSFKEKSNNIMEFRFGRGDNVPITGFFSKHPILKTNNIKFQSFDFFCRCPTCKVILPKREILYHLPPYIDSETCVQLEDNCVIYGPGVYLNNGLIIGIFFDPFLQLKNIIEKLNCVLNGEKEFDDDFINWIKELQKLHLKDNDPREWLKQLIENLKTIMSLFDKRQFNMVDLNLVTDSLLSQSDAIRFVIQRIKEIAIVE